VDKAEVRRMDELAGLRQSAPVLLVPCNPLLEKTRELIRFMLETQNANTSSS